jgi:hypothetical protein
MSCTLPDSLAQLQSTQSRRQTRSLTSGSCCASAKAQQLHPNRRRRRTSPRSRQTTRHRSHGMLWAALQDSMSCQSMRLQHFLSVLD